MSADTSWCTRVWAGAPAEAQGSNPWNIYGDRAAPIFIWYEKSRFAESSRETRKIYPPLFRFISGLSGLLPSPVAPSGPFYSAHRPLSRVFTRFPTCGLVSLSISLFALGRREKRWRVFYREKVPFIFAPRIRRVFERRRRDMLMLVGAMKFWWRWRNPEFQ